MSVDAPTGLDYNKKIIRAFGVDLDATNPNVERVIKLIPELAEVTAAASLFGLTLIVLSNLGNIAKPHSPDEVNLLLGARTGLKIFLAMSGAAVKTFLEEKRSSMPRNPRLLRNFGQAMVGVGASELIPQLDVTLGGVPQSTTVASQMSIDAFVNGVIFVAGAASLATAEIAHRAGDIKRSFSSKPPNLNVPQTRH